MRINRYIALATGVSRRQADVLIASSKVTVNSQPANAGQVINSADNVAVNGELITLPKSTTTIALNKPIGFVCSREGQGSKTIYELLPDRLHNLKPVGRLDKDSSGLLLLTDDGELANRLTHPKYQKEKTYEVALSKPLSKDDLAKITTEGIVIDKNRPSKLQLEPFNSGLTKWHVKISEGRNRQIRRTFGALGYSVIQLHRTQFGPYQLENLKNGNFTEAT